MEWYALAVPHTLLAHAHPSARARAHLIDACTRMGVVWVLRGCCVLQVRIASRVPAMWCRSPKRASSTSRVARTMRCDAPHTVAARTCLLECTLFLRMRATCFCVCCRYEAWRDKFQRHVSHMDAQRKADIPFAFYRDSITMLQDDKTGGEGVSATRSQSAPLALP